MKCVKIEYSKNSLILLFIRKSYDFLINFMISDSIFSLFITEEWFIFALKRFLIDWGKVAPNFVLISSKASLSLYFWESCFKAFKTVGENFVHSAV